MAKTKIKIPLIVVIIIVVALVVIAIIFGDVAKEGKQDLGNISKQIYGFSAEIKSIKGKTLSLEAWIPMADVEQNPIKASIKAIATDNTKIVRLKFPANIPKDSKEPIYPEETKISFDDLKVGEKIDIGAADNISEKIKNKQEFEIKHIFIIE